MPQVTEIVPEPEQGPSKPTSGGFGSIFNRLLSKIQRYSAYGFQVFVCLHLSGVILAPIISPRLGETTISLGRTMYQSTIGEPLLIYASAGLHVLSGNILHIKRLIKQRRAGIKGKFFTSVIQKSGIITSFLVLGHFLAVRGGVLAKLDGDSSLIGLDYIRWTMSHGIGGSISMLMLVTAFTHHAVMGFNRWLTLGMSGRKRNGIVVTTTLLALISLIRIRQLPLVTGWQVEQFKQAHSLISTLVLV